MGIKPVCSRCSQPHWRFVPCAELDAENDREARKNALKVVPVFVHNLDRVPRDRLRTMTEVAPNVFTRIRPDDAA